MKNGLVKRVIAPFVPLILAASITFGCHPPVPNPSPDVYAAEKQAITRAADRLVELQDNDGLEGQFADRYGDTLESGAPDGSWDWNVTGQTGPTGTSYYGVTGITAEGLLTAYNVIGDVRYLDSAKKAGDYLIDVIGGSSVDITKRPSATNALFLYHLAEVSGESKYRTKANAIMSNLLYEDNYWAHNYGNHTTDDHLPGCTAQELFDAEKEFRTSLGDPNGTVIWDLYAYVEAAQKYGLGGSFVSDLATLCKNYLENSSYNASRWYYSLGLSSGIQGLDKAGSDYTNVLDKLLNAQNVDGSWTDSDDTVQNNSYAIMALSKIGHKSDIEQAKQKTLDDQQANGGWLVFANGNPNQEISSADGEGIQALGDYVN